MAETNNETTTAEKPEESGSSPQNQFSRFVRMVISVILFTVIWILFITLLPVVNRDLLTNALRAVIILIGGFLPAIIFGYFQSRRQILFIEYQQNLRRLGFIENAQIYRRKFDAIYGNSDMFDRREIVFQTPIIVATILSVVGWIFVFYPPTPDTMTLAPNATTLAYGFLGAYVFAIGSLVRQYITDDLQQRYYASVVYRYLAVFVLAALITFILPGETSGGILALAFTIGFFPSMGIRIAIRVGTNLVNSIFQQPVQGFEDEDRLHLLQGPNAYHEDRLLLEGIENIQNLACADIVDLMLKTRFPVEQIVDWIDQSLLYLHTGPSYLPTLRKKGVRTATDFIDLVDQEKPAENGLLTGENPLSTSHLNTIATALRNDPNMFHVRYWRDHQFELLTEDIALTRAANLKLMQGQPEEAILLYDQFLRQFPKDHQGHFYRGLAHSAAKKFGRAADDYRTALALAGSKWENASVARIQLGMTLQELGQLDDAAEAFRQTFILDKNFAEAYLEYARLILEEYFVRSTPEERPQYLQEARENLQQAVKLKPEMLQAYLSLGTVYERLGNKAEAKKIYSDLLTRPESKSDKQAAYLGYLQRGNLLFEEGKNEEALSDYQNAVEISPTPIAYFNLGQTQARLNQPGLALEAFNHAVRLNDEYPEAYQRLGEMAFQLGRYNEAIDAFSRELTLRQENDNKPAQMIAHLNLGRSYRQLKNLSQDAIRELGKAADLGVQLRDDLVFTNASYEMGLTYYEIKEMAKAADQFSTAAELFDVLQPPRRLDSAEAGLFYARTLQDQGKTDEALKAITAAENRLNAIVDQSTPGVARVQADLTTLRQSLSNS